VKKINNKKNSHRSSDASSAKNSRKEYEKPVLIAYGDVRDVTLGGTGGLGESGCECLFRELPSGASAGCPIVCPR